MPVGINFQRSNRWFRRGVFGGAGVGEVNAPLHVIPQAVAPTDVTEGNVFYDSVRNALVVADGAAYVPAGTSAVVKTGAATLTAADSGALCLFNAAAGFLYTLPAAVAGLRFKFIVTVTATSLVHRVACAAGDFLLGTILQGSDGTYVTVARDADGTTHLAWEGNGSTKGGIKGDWFEVVAISATQWAVYGYNSATGSEATPFVTV